jgi:alpha-mannosidase
MLPQQITYNGVQFQLAAAKTGAPNALIAKGQTINLPSGRYNRLYVLAASTGGDQKTAIQVDNQSTELNVEDWGGFIGQWDDREWTSKEVKIPARRRRPARTETDPYAEMVGLKPGYIKRANLAWYCSFHHDPAGQNVPYRYSYLFAYVLDMPTGAKTITLPNNEKIRILAISVAEENPEAKPVQPLYDTLERVETAAQRASR